MELSFERQREGKAGAREGAEPEHAGARVFEATEAPFKEDVPEEFRDAALEYELKLYNGVVARAVVYLVYAEPQRERDGTGKKGVSDGRGYTWVPVLRSKCAKGCEGPILSAIQRFGKQGRTQKSAAQQDSAHDAKPTAEDKWKDTRNLFISIDEASNHVCVMGPNKCKTFRLLFGVYEQNSRELLGSGVSGPIRVLANNDVPKGAAAMKVRCALSDTWSAWKANAVKSEDELRDLFKALCPPPLGKANGEKGRDRRSDETVHLPQGARKPLWNKTNFTGKSTKRQSLASAHTMPQVPAKRARVSGAHKVHRPAAVPVLHDFDFNVQEAMEMGAADQHDLPFHLQSMMQSPIGTPPDQRQVAPANPFAGLFGTPDYLSAPEVIADGLDTADLPNICTPGDKKNAVNFQDAIAMPPPTTGMGAFRFTPGALPPIASTGSLMSLSGLDSLGIAFGKTPVDFKAKKTESKVFTRSAAKGPAEPTPMTRFVNSLLASGQATASARRATRSVVKEDATNDAAPSTTRAHQKEAILQTADAPQQVEVATAAPQVIGAVLAEGAYNAAPARTNRSRHGSPNGVAPVRLFFASPVGYGGEPLEGSDDEYEVGGFTSPSMRHDVPSDELAGTRQNGRQAPKIRLPRMASVPEIGGEFAAEQKATERAAKAARLSGHFRPVKVPPPPKHVAADPGSIKRRTRNMVSFSNDVNFQNAPSTSKRLPLTDENEANISSLRSPEWPSHRNQRALSKNAGVSGRVKESDQQGFMATIRSAVSRTIGASH